MNDEEFIKYPEDCTPEELEEQIQKIKKRFGSMKNATKFLESLKDKKTPAELLQALHDFEDKRKRQALYKTWAKELLWILGVLGALVYVDGFPSRGWLLFILLIVLLWVTQKITTIGILSERIKNHTWLFLIISCLGGHFLIGEYGSKDPHSYWSRNSALILQEVEFKGPFFDGSFIDELLMNRYTRRVHLERELHKDSYPDLNWTENGRDAVWEDAEKFPSRKALMIAKYISYSKPKGHFKVAPLELQYTDDNGTQRVIRLSFSRLTAGTLNNWCSADEYQMPDYNASTRKTFEILIPPQIENKFLEDPKLESEYLAWFRYGYLFD